MEKILVISATNRPNSNSMVVSEIYKAIVTKLGLESDVLSFTNLPEGIVAQELYGKRTVEYDQLIEKYVRGYSKFIFVVPEYNGSFPGVLKVFLDSVSPKEWTNKKACLVGVSTGRAGNLRGMEHLTGILNYLKLNVYFNKLPISMVDKHYNEDKSGFNTEAQQTVCEEQVRGFVGF